MKEKTYFCVSVTVWTFGMKVMEELNMSRKIVILMEYNGLTAQASNIENLEFIRECYALIEVIHDPWRFTVQDEGQTSEQILICSKSTMIEACAE